MYALRVARSLYGQSKKGLRGKLVKSSRRRYCLNAPSLVSIQHHHRIHKHKQPKLHKTRSRLFHASPSLRWQHPDHLSTSELRRECERRSLPTKGSRTALIERLKQQITDSGGYDDGLTLDDQLANEKRQIESQMNRVKDSHYSVCSCLCSLLSMSNVL